MISMVDLPSVLSDWPEPIITLLSFSQTIACAGGGLSPALCEYNEQAATVRTPARDKNIDATRRMASCPEDIQFAIGSHHHLSI
jgi:hypothetical protein